MLLLLFLLFGMKERGNEGEGERERFRSVFFFSTSEAANLDVFFFLDFGHFLVLLET